MTGSARAVTASDVEHERRMHPIVVRRDRTGHADRLFLRFEHHGAVRTVAHTLVVTR